MRASHSFTLDDPQTFKRRAIHWASQFRHALCLDSNGHWDSHSSFDFLLAADADDILSTGWGDAFDRLESFHRMHRDWIFGYMGYDLKNGLEKLDSAGPDHLGFSDMLFFRPKKLLILVGNELQALYLEGDSSADVAQILQAEISSAEPKPLEINARLSRDEYITRVLEMKRRIGLGDIYEANFCMDFYAEGPIEPAQTFDRLNAISTAPFAAFLRAGERFLMCSSPERYLRREGSKIISQPIKGTAPRGSDPASDAALAKNLALDPKERSENIMIVDLVRNDLSKTACKGSVKVEELCGVHTFRQVHQLISTITSKLRDECSAVDAIRTTFPMGSMTGAPKISAMNIIEQLEAGRRGLYSGAVGYFTPEGDFDFNVVIRSILYNRQNEYASFHVGSAITHLSNPEAEYRECQLKARAMMRVLGG